MNLSFKPEWYPTKSVKFELFHCFPRDIGGDFNHQTIFQENRNLNYFIHILKLWMLKWIFWK